MNTRVASPLAGAVVTAVDDNSNLLFYGNLAQAFLGSAASNSAVYSGVAVWTNSSTLRFGGGSSLLIYPYAISPVNGQSNLLVGPVGGDTLFANSIGRTDLPGGNLKTLLHSIRTQLFVLDGATIVYPGHGPETTIGDERRNNPFLQD